MLRKTLLLCNDVFGAMSYDIIRTALFSEKLLHGELASQGCLCRGFFL